jgi:hypothetical protein
MDLPGEGPRVALVHRRRVGIKHHARRCTANSRERIRGLGEARGALESDAEELLPHEQHVARAHVGARRDAHEGAVGAPEIGQKKPLTVPGQAAVQPET